jgi:pimeloyl-ACP methyl ester carboxylesterase
MQTAQATQTLEYAWIEPEGMDKGASPLVFLHEGLGSIALWRRFPADLCAQLGRRGLVYSRFGYGRSTPRPRDEPLPPDYLEREANETLPALLAALLVENSENSAKPWLVGHSDGGSIALIAAAQELSTQLAGIVVIAPHYFVEEVCLTGIERARRAYEEGDLRPRLARHHQEVDSVFHGWHDVWMDPARRGWNLRHLLPQIACPLLAIQGREDEYATLEQIEGIRRHLPHAELRVIEACGHFPHLTRADETIAAIAAFIRESEGKNR